MFFTNISSPVLSPRVLVSIGHKHETESETGVAAYIDEISFCTLQEKKDIRISFFLVLCSPNKVHLEIPENTGNFDLEFPQI